MGCLRQNGLLRTAVLVASSIGLWFLRSGFQVNLAREVLKSMEPGGSVFLARGNSQTKFELEMWEEIFL